MDPSLRKTHRRIWIILAIILPIIFVLAIMVIPKDAEQEVLYQDVDPIQLEQTKSEDSNQKETE